MNNSCIAHTLGALRGVCLLGSVLPFALVIAGFGAASDSHAETWKTATFRKTDSAPIFVDTDYLVERGDAIEVRVKYKQEKNPLLLLLPDVEVEEHYLYKCDAKKVAMSYRKTTKFGQSSVEADVLPSAVVFSDFAQGTILQIVADWACPEYKKQLSSAKAASSSSNQTSKTSQRDEGGAKWRFAASSLDNKERYWIDVASLLVDQKAVQFWVRETLSSPRSVGSGNYITSLARYSTDCVSEQISSAGTSFYDANGQVVSSNPQAGTLLAAPGTIARFVYDAACAMARGGDVGKSRVFPKGISDPSTIELRQVSGLTSNFALYVDAKSVYRDRSQPFAVAKFVAIRTDQPTDPMTDAAYFYFFTSVFNCSKQTSDDIASETFDGFMRMTASQYKTFEQLQDKPIAPGTDFQAVKNTVCAFPITDETSRTDQSGSKEAPATIGSGTAWYLDVGYVVTAYHVVEGRSRIILYGADKKPVVATVIAADKANDIALLDAKFSTRPAVGLAVARSPATLGAHVFTIGFPHPDVMGISPKFTAGEVSAIAGINDDPRVFQISVPVQAGNSGGPLVNTSGEVVGIVSSKLPAEKVFNATGDLTQNVNYAIKARYLQGMLDDLGGGAAKAARPHGGGIQNIVSQVTGAIFLVVVE